MRLFLIAAVLFFVVPLIGIVHDVRARQESAKAQCAHHRTFVERDTGERRFCSTRPAR